MVIVQFRQPHIRFGILLPFLTCLKEVLFTRDLVIRMMSTHQLWGKLGFHSLVTTIFIYSDVWFQGLDITDTENSFTSQFIRLANKYKNWLFSTFLLFANLQWKPQQATGSRRWACHPGSLTSRVSLTPPGLFSKQQMFFTLIVTSWSSYTLSNPQVFCLGIILLLGLWYLYCEPSQAALTGRKFKSLS